MTPDGHPVPELPALEPGLTLLEDDAVPGALQSLVVDHLLSADGPVRWVDARNTATTQYVARLAPSDRLLERIHVARAFTAFQHYSLVETLGDLVDDATALLVLPAVDWFYDADELRPGEARAMLAGVLERVEAYSAAHDVPVLLTLARESIDDGPIEEHLGTRLRCERTQFGPRFSTDGFETLVYPVEGGVQTTLAFWRSVLRRRHRGLTTPHPTEVPAHGAH